MGSLGPKVSSCGQQRLWSHWVDAKADLSLRWAHSHFVGFVMWLSCCVPFPFGAWGRICNSIVSVSDHCINEPAHEIMALFILRKLILQMRIRSHPVGVRCLIFGRILRLLPYFMCVNREGSGVCVISTIISCAGSFLIKRHTVMYILYCERGDNPVCLGRKCCFWNVYNIALKSPKFNKASKSLRLIIPCNIANFIIFRPKNIERK